MLFLAVAAPGAQGQVFTVTNLSDSGVAGDGSLRGEVVAANASSGVDTVNFASGLSGTITLGGNGLQITDPIDIEGPGPAQITVAQSTANRVVHIALPIVGAVRLAGLHIAGGSAPNSGAFPAGAGADILNENAHAALTVANSVISGGQAAEGGGGIDSEGPLTLVASSVTGNHAGFDGGILAREGFTIQASTISGNSAGTYTGGLYAQQVSGTGAIEASTISGNTASAEAGGVELNATGSAGIRISNSTVSGNTAGGNAGGIFMSTYTSATVSIEGSTIADNHANGGDGGGLRTYATLELDDTIVAGNTATGVGPDIYASSGHSLSTAFSLIGNPTGETNKEVLPGSDLVGVDPQLGPLQDNGGPTQTMAPSPTSPAVNKGAAFGLATDQRGLPRPVAYPGVASSAAPGADGADIGAFELQLSPNEFSFGKVRLNKKKGTATIEVDVPDAGEVALAGTKKVKKESKAATGGSTLKLTIRARGKALKSLRKKGKVKVKATFTFVPSGGLAASKVKSLKLVRKR